LGIKEGREKGKDKESIQEGDVTKVKEQHYLKQLLMKN
jgi:hypothetical protein